MISRFGLLSFKPDAHPKRKREYIKVGNKEALVKSRSRSTRCTQTGYFDQYLELGLMKLGSENNRNNEIDPRNECHMWFVSDLGSYKRYNICVEITKLRKRILRDITVVSFQCQYIWTQSQSFPYQTVWKQALCGIQWVSEERQSYFQCTKKRQ